MVFSQFVRVAVQVWFTPPDDAKFIAVLRRRARVRVFQHNRTCRA